MKKIVKISIFLLMFIIGFNTVKAENLKEGIYTIESSLEHKVLETVEGSENDGTNVQINENKNANNQKWKLKKVANDYYQIISVADESKALDVAGGGQANGANAQIYTINNTIAQNWYIKYVGNGYYSLISQCNGLYLDVTGGSSNNGTNVWLYSSNNTNSQKFKLIENIENSQTIKDGTYTIQSSINPNKVIDLAGGNTNNLSNIQLFSFNNTWAQIWNIKYLEDGYYSITSYLNNNKSIEIYENLDNNGQNVDLFDQQNTDAQKWIIKDNGDGYYNIISKTGHKYLDVCGGSTSDGTNIQIYQGNNTTSQKFKFVKKEIKIIKNGIYTISSKMNKDKVVSLNSIIAYNTANVELNTNQNINTQKWYIKNISQELYSITSAANENRSIDVAGGGQANGTNLWIYNNNSSSAQKWYIKYEDGYYKIISQCNNLNMNAADIIQPEHNNIFTWQNNDSDNQKFTIDETNLNYNYQSYEDGYYIIASELDENKVLDATGGQKFNGTNLQLYNRNNTLAQIWHLKYLNNGYYNITSSMNPKVSFNVNNGGMTNGTNVELYHYYNNDSQTWMLKDYGDGQVSIVSKQNGLYLNVEDSKTDDGTNIICNSENNKQNQKFKLIKYTDKKVYHGIDVSSWQKKIEWEKTANSINFAIIRLGYGSNFVDQDDTYFLQNIEECEKYNIPYAIYLYSYATEEQGDISAESEADHTIRLLNIIKEKNYTPLLGTNVYFDMEDYSTQNIGQDKLLSIANTYCKKIEDSGYKCGIYANKKWLEQILNAIDLAKNYTIWLANYTGSTTYDNALNNKSSYNLTNYKIWQFSSTGNIAGINGNVDMDLGWDIFD